MNKTYLYPGQIIIAQGDCKIRTLLGSCVAVALADTEANIGGMIHFLLPEPMGEDVNEPLRYGKYSIPELIRELVASGAARQRLQAKVFGGARVLGGVSQSLDVGSFNVRITRQLLNEYHIPILEEKVGGEVGCTIVMNVVGFQVEHKFIAKKNNHPVKASGE